MFLYAGVGLLQGSFGTPIQPLGEWHLQVSSQLEGLSTAALGDVLAPLQSGTDSWQTAGNEKHGAC